MNLLKVLIVFLGLTSFLHADMDGFEFWVGNYTMARAYFDIFNGIAALMQNPLYIQLLQLVFTIGAFSVFLLGVFKTLQGADAKGGIADFAKYVIAGSMILMLALPDPDADESTTAVLLVQAKENSNTFCDDLAKVNGSVVDHSTYSAFSVALPQTLAWFFASVNTIGYEMTNLATAAFSSVSLSSSVNSSLAANAASGFGAGPDAVNNIADFSFDKLSATYRNTTFVSASFGKVQTGTVLVETLPYFLKECLYSVGGENETLGANINYTMKNTADTYKTLNSIYVDKRLEVYPNTYGGSPSSSVDLVSFGANLDMKFITFTDMDGVETTGFCGDMWTEVVGVALGNIPGSEMLCTPGLAKSFNPGTMYLLTGNKTQNTVAVAGGIAKQAAVNAASRNVASSSMLDGQISFASVKSQNEFISSSVGSGKYMAQMLPYLQMGIRAVLYAFFPFVFLVIMLPGGFAVAKSYAQSMIWVELWSPVAAILNYFLGYFQLDKMAQAGGDGMNAVNASGLVSDANMLASVGGYLYASVPALTYLILKGSAQMLGSITGGMASGFSKNMDSDQINRDISEVEKKDQFNKSTGQNKSLAAVQQLAALGEGQQSGAEMGRDFELGGSSDKGYLKGKSNLGKGTSNKNEDTRNYGQLDSKDIKAASAASVGLDFQTKVQKLKTMGIVKEDGTIDQQKLKDSGLGIGGSEAVDLMTKDKVFKDTMGEGYTPKEAGQVLSNIAAGKKIGENSKEFKFLQAIHQLDNPNAAPLTLSQASEKAIAIHKDISTVQANEEVKTHDRNEQSQVKQGQVKSVSNSTTVKEFKKMAGLGEGAIVNKTTRNNRAVFTGVDTHGNKVYAVAGKKFLRTDTSQSTKDGSTISKEQQQKLLSETQEQVGTGDQMAGGNNWKEMSFNGNTRKQSKAASYEEDRKLTATQTLAAVMNSGTAGHMDGLKNIQGYGDFKGAAKGLSTSLHNAATNARNSGDTKTADKYDKLANGITNENGSINANGLMAARSEASQMKGSTEVMDAVQKLDNQTADLQAGISTKDRATFNTSDFKAKLSKGLAQGVIIDKVGQDIKMDYKDTNGKIQHGTAQEVFRRDLASKILTENGEEVNEESLSKMKDLDMEGMQSYAKDNFNMSEGKFNTLAAASGSIVNAGISGKNAAWKELVDSGVTDSIAKEFGAAGAANAKTFDQAKSIGAADLLTNDTYGAAASGAVVGKVEVGEKALSATHRLSQFVKNGKSLKDWIASIGK